MAAQASVARAHGDQERLTGLYSLLIDPAGRMPATSCASGAWYRPTIRTGRPNIGDHTLFRTTEPNGIVEPIHEKAMPVMLITPDEVEKWLRGSPILFVD
jgi:hypothetical protein